MKDDKFIMLSNRLTRVFRHLGRQARKAGVACFRIYDQDIPEFPFLIEQYENCLAVSEYNRRHGMTDEEHESWLERSVEIMSKVTAIPAADIYIRTRKRKRGHKDQYLKREDTGKELIVHENGLQFIVNLTDYVDTGLFLDHRETRKLLRTNCAGGSVLNLFAYTGSFSVYAAAGGASRVLTVDLSKTYQDWSKRNMELNGFTDRGKYEFIQADVLQFIGDPRGEKFDWIVLDPPTFSNSQRMKDILDVQRDHVSLINRCLDWLNPGGTIIFSTNFSKFQMEAEKIKGVVKDITRSTTPFDFEGKLKRYCYLVNSASRIFIPAH